MSEVHKDTIHSYKSNPQVRVVFTAVQEVTEWITLGVHLNLELPQLKRIEEMYSDPKRRLLEMLNTWLEAYPHASWSDIVKALRSMEQNVLAKKIEERYLDASTCITEEECPRKHAKRSAPDMEESVVPGQQPTPDVQVLKEKVVEMNHQSISERFIQLVLFVLQSLEALAIDTQDVCLAVSNFPCCLSKHANVLLFDKQREKIRNASTLRILFNLLSDYKYWDWKNYKLLHAIVSIFGTEQLKERVKEYEKELQAFHVNLKLSTLAETVPLTKDELMEKPDFVRLTAKLEKGIPWADYTMQRVEEFWQSFTEEYLLNKYTLFFHNAKPGCACLTFLIPSAIAPYLIVESQPKTDFLVSQDVVKLTIGDQCVYELEKAKDQKKLDDKQGLEAENESLRELVQTLEQTNAEQQEIITELKAQQRISRPVGGQSMDVNAEDECVAYNVDERSHFSWTLNLNGFFYSHIHSHDSNVLQSSYFVAPNGKSHYQVILSPRSFDKWDNRHCSLFLLVHGSEIQFPTKAVLQCRLPGVQGDGYVEQYFQFSGSDLLTQKKVIAANCFVVSEVHTFLSYSFFMKHLNIMPFFQIVVDLSFKLITKKIFLSDIKNIV